jgi:hypothetical protein
MDCMSQISRFSVESGPEWDAFVRKARNGHFFFERGFMEYHADRFDDHSLLFRNDQGLRAVLPANRVGDTLYSHQGLTFGGLVIDRARGAEVIGLLQQGIDFLAKEGFKRLIYKALPTFYHRQPAEDDRYALHRMGARLVRRELSSVIDLAAPFTFSGGKNDNLRRARKAGLLFEEIGDPGPVIELVSAVLADRHGATATHTPEELRLLAGRFPENIRTFVARRDGRLLAGAVVFLNGHVVHTQYLANSEEGLSCGALDFVVASLIRNVFADRRWFSFGISTENGGQDLNTGLLAYKEGFGGHGVTHDMVELEL